MIFKLIFTCFQTSVTHLEAERFLRDSSATMINLPRECCVAAHSGNSSSYPITTKEVIQYAALETITFRSLNKVNKDKTIK